MRIRLNTFQLIIFCSLLFGFNQFVLAQKDSLRISNMPTGISDSLTGKDSTNIGLVKNSFLFKIKNKNNDKIISAFGLSKKQIDKSDYKYFGNILSQLPFSFLNDLGYLGAPSEPNIYSFGFGNISVLADDNSIFNRWNNSSDLNWVQTEEISYLKIEPLNRGFLFGFINNLSTINIISNDSIKSKPISRIRYYQAPNNERFLDAMFSARVLPRLALSFRISSSSVESNYTNTEFGSWKVNVKGIYKLSDSLFAKVTYSHLKLNTALNGGIDVNTLLMSSSSPESEIFNTQAPVVYNTMKNVTSSNNFSARIYGSFIPFGNTNIRIAYNQNSDIFRNDYDSTSIKNSNDYNTFATTIKQDLIFSNLTSTISVGYEEIDYDLESILYNEKQTNYYALLISDYNFLNGLVRPAIFGKYSDYNSQSNSGYGIDLTIRLSKEIKLFLGFSNFDKPFSIIESYYLSKNIQQNYSTNFASLEYGSGLMNTSISYFNTESTNSPMPVFNSSDLTKSTTGIIYTTTDKIETRGININSKIELWNILATANFNNYWQSENSLAPKAVNYNLTAGLYYVDTLYNSNLDLKTGFTFHLFDNLEYRVYDFQKMRSSGYYLDNNSFHAFDFYATNNDPYSIDFLLAGRIQDAATFYFIFENILGNKYYVVPYYPMPEGRIRFGISWDFID